MKIRITGPSGKIYAVAAHEVIAKYIKLSFLLSPLAIWKLYDILKPVYEILKVKGWIG